MLSFNVFNLYAVPTCMYHDVIFTNGISFMNVTSIASVKSPCFSNIFR